MPPNLNEGKPPSRNDKFTIRLMDRAAFLERVHLAHSRVALWLHNNPNGGPCREDRIVYYFELLNHFDLLRPGVRLVDLGGGLSWFAPIAFELGLETVLIDDFGGGGGLEHQSAQESRAILDRMRAKGIQIHEVDFLSNPLPLPGESIDVVTCFHSLEHWHNSPKPLFAHLRRVIKMGGFLALATPNAVNMRKRIAVALGKTNLSRLEEWYGEPIFRGHVREPIIADLCKLLEWNQFAVREISGRNFIGRASESLANYPRGLANAIAVASQSFLRYFPSLCSDIHVVGQKQ
jgi:SAM-dependent methyltransferase